MYNLLDPYCLLRRIDTLREDCIEEMQTCSEFASTEDEHGTYWQERLKFYDQMVGMISAAVFNACMDSVGREQRKAKT
jgi:hypothetical protein